MTKQIELAAALSAAILNNQFTRPRDLDFAQSLVRGFARYGTFTARQLPHVERLISDAGVKAAKLQHAPQPTMAAAIGDLSGILALFAHAKTHLKFPAIVLGVPAISPDFAIRVNVAGAKAREPGSLTVVDAMRDENEGRREYLGNVDLRGLFRPSRSAAVAALSARIAMRLREFAADPARVASEHGRLTGRCCFCNLPLSDARSTAVGYGKTCASKWGLPWGARAAALDAPSLPFAIDPDEAAMMRMEAEGDRAQTIRDEHNKHRARAAMETYSQDSRFADDESRHHVRMHGGDGW
jgi:hypothetical protein